MFEIKACTMISKSPNKRNCFSNRPRIDTKNLQVQTVVVFPSMYLFALENVDGNGRIQKNVIKFAKMFLRSLEVVFAFF